MTILYEQPLNERMRTLLRLEHLFAQTRNAMEGESEWEHRTAIASLIEVLSLLERADLKTEFIKELDRIMTALARLKSQPKVDPQALNEIVETLKTHYHILQNTPGRLGDPLRSNELITAVRQRLAIPGGSCVFDLPLLHYWLSQSAHTRKEALKSWYTLFEPIESSVSLILNVIRESAYHEKVTAHQGYFQKLLDLPLPCQLIRVSLSKMNAFPEISGGKHRISIRFLTHNETLHSVPVQEDVHFSLACCLI